jgi:hypothetical protein
MYVITTEKNGKEAILKKPNGEVMEFEKYSGASTFIRNFGPGWGELMRANIVERR